MMQLRKREEPKVPKRQNSDVSALERRGYKFGSVIGKGSYGKVVVARYQEEGSGEMVDLACKYVDKSKAPKDFLKKFFPREIQILTEIQHSNIIGIHSILQSGSTVFIFMRRAENGDLLDYVKKHGPIPENQACAWFFQLVSAIRYLHNKNYAHRDLKCENILISKHMNLKIADFGFARNCVDENNHKIYSQTFCGSAGELIILKGKFLNFLIFPKPTLLLKLSQERLTIRWRAISGPSVWFSSSFLTRSCHSTTQTWESWSRIRRPGDINSAGKSSTSCQKSAKICSSPFSTPILSKDRTLTLCTRWNGWKSMLLRRFQNELGSSIALCNLNLFKFSIKILRLSLVKLPK